MTRLHTKLNSLVTPFLLGGLLATAVIQFLYSQQLSQELSNVYHKNTVSYSPASYADAVSRAFSSVVKIYTARVVETPAHPLLNDPFFKRFFNQNQTSNRDKIERGLGSGVIADKRGYILTNYHLIKNVDRISIMLSDGRVEQAKIVGIDEETDLAVLKIELKNLTPAIFAKPDSGKIGDVVLAIGNPYGIGQTVTQGIISATGRYGLNLNTYENYIQTDAAINQGNSGGALINSSGELIAINSSLYSHSGASTGIGFAIPAKTALYVLRSIVQHGEVVRGWLGISVEDITPGLAQALSLGNIQGLLVTNIAIGGPANQAGITAGDIITHFDNQLIQSGNMSMHKIAQTRPGTHIAVRLLRNGSAQSTLVTVSKRPKQQRSH